MAAVTSTSSWETDTVTRTSAPAGAGDGSTATNMVRSPLSSVRTISGCVKAIPSSSRLAGPVPISVAIGPVVATRSLGSDVPGRCATYLPGATPWKIASPRSLVLWSYDSPACPSVSSLTTISGTGPSVASVTRSRFTSSKTDTMTVATVWTGISSSWTEFGVITTVTGSTSLMLAGMPLSVGRNVPGDTKTWYLPVSSLRDSPVPKWT